MILLMAVVTLGILLMWSGFDLACRRFTLLAQRLALSLFVGGCIAVVWGLALLERHLYDMHLLK